MLQIPEKSDEELKVDLCRFADQELRFEAIDDDFVPDQFLHNWRACAKYGLLGPIVPPEFGGGGLDITNSVRLLETFGYAFPDDGFTLAINGQVWAVTEPILQFGNEEQKKRFLPSMVDGSAIAALAMTEEDSGSDAFEMTTTADKVDGGYLLNGQKIYTGLGPIADLALVFASTAPGRGRWGISAFVVDARSDGVILSEPQEKMGLRSSPLGNIQFKDAFVETERMLGREGSGAAIFIATMDFERSFILSSHVGAMARLLEETIKFAKQRKIGGQSIGKHQSISNRIADMKVRLDAARLFLYQAAGKLDEGTPAAMEAAMANLVISENYVQNCMDAVRIHGGKGYMKEFGIERKLRDAMAGVIYSGTSDIQRNVIAGILGVG